MIKIKRLVDCTIQEGVEAWNSGFEGYYFDATMTPEKFINRFTSEGLSPSLSIVAFQDHKPVGIVKNGIRVFNGKKIAWNGGTAVASQLRGKGIGKLLMEETLLILEKENVHLATLEAISENQHAISLYEKMGFEIIDELEYLSLNGPIETDKFVDYMDDITIERSVPQQVGHLPFYQGMHPWQTQWQSAKDGEALIIKDSTNAAIGYAYFRRGFDDKGKHISTVLYQCEAEPSHKNSKKLIKVLLHEVFGTFDDSINRVIPNMPIRKSEQTHTILKGIGFQHTAKQVYMMKKMLV